MDKVRFDIPKYEKVYDVEIDVAGKLVNVCSRLSEEEKEHTAQRLAFAQLIMDEDSGVAFEPFNSKQMEDIIILDTYTTIDVDWINTEEDKNSFLQFIYSNDVMDAVRPVCKDLNDVMNMSCYIVEASRLKFERQYSPVNRLIRMFVGEEGENMSFESMLENPDAIEFMSKMSKEKQKVDSPKLGNGILNFSKKDITE